MHLFVVIEVCWDDHHDAACCESDDECEVGDVESPGDVVGHVGCDHAVGELVGPCINAY